MTEPLRRRALAEFLGTGLLVTVIVGSGIAAQSLNRGVGIELLENALATAAGLAVLILILGPISGAHFNPVVSLTDCLLSHRQGRGLTTKALPAYLVAQVTGAGAVLANAMFARPLVKWSQHDRSSGHVFLGEVVATAGLILVLVALSRSRRTSQMPWAVGIYIGSAYWFTSSTSFANPAVAIGRAFTDSFAGIAPSSVPIYVAAEFIGGAVAIALAAALYPKSRHPASWKGEPQEALTPSADSMLEESG
jgi:glycerol uptake facilitator-like aquaporin